MKSEAVPIKPDQEILTWELQKILQIPKSKVVLFCPFSKMRSKIVKITKFQNAVKIALVNEFK